MGRGREVERKWRGGWRSGGKQDARQQQPRTTCEDVRGRRGERRGMERREREGWMERWRERNTT